MKIAVRANGRSHTRLECAQHKGGEVLIGIGIHIVQKGFQLLDGDRGLRAGEIASR